MNHTEAATEVVMFRNAVHANTAAWEYTDRTGDVEPVNHLDLASQCSSRLPIVEAIAREVGLQQPERLRMWNVLGERGEAVNAANELLGMVNGRERWEEVFGPSGPSLVASRMHPWVWQPAAKQWDAGHRRDAIQRAATQVFDTELRSKVHRYDMQPLDLVGHVFNEQDPGPGDVRLRIPGYAKGTPEWRDAHKGAREIGKGCVSSIRNLMTHGLDEPSEPVGLEALAVLSWFARRVDDCNVEIG